MKASPFIFSGRTLHRRRGSRRGCPCAGAASAAAANPSTENALFSFPARARVGLIVAVEGRRVDRGPLAQLVEEEVVVGDGEVPGELAVVRRELK